MNVIKYLKTKFLRFLVLLKKNTQHAKYMHLFKFKILHPKVILIGVNQFLKSTNNSM